MVAAHPPNENKITTTTKNERQDGRDGGARSKRKETKSILLAFAGCSYSSYVAVVDVSVGRSTMAPTRRIGWEVIPLLFSVSGKGEREKEKKIIIIRG